MSTVTTEITEITEATTDRVATPPPGRAEAEHRPAPLPDGTTVPPRVRPRLLLGPVIAVMSSGLVVGAWAVGRARSGDLGPGTQWLFWIGLLLTFVPAAARIIARSVRGSERIALALALPVLLQLGRVVLYPRSFMFHDELIHANALRLVNQTHRLFAPNSLLPVAAYYPGMSIATDGVEQLTGLSAHTSAVVVLVAARIVSTLAIVGVMRRLTGSTRAACTASLVYTCNPQAFFFNSQYSYQSFALPLAIFAVWAFVARRRAAPLWRQLALPVIATAAVAVSHHLTAMLLVGAFAVWAALDGVVARRDGHPDRRPLTVMAVLGAVFVLGWAALPGNPVFGYLGAIAQSSVSDIQQRLAGHDSHQLFHSSGGLVSPLWERIATIASILLVLLAVLPVVALMRRWVRARHAALVLFGLGALAYPIIPIGHVTPGTGEITDRASGFLFFGVGLAVAVGPLFRARPSRRAIAPLVTAGLTVAFTVVFVGGVILGAGSTVGQLPGPFLVSADARSIDAANIAAAVWEREHLPRNTRIYADRDAGLLAAAVGGMHTVTHVGDDVDASRILLAPTYTSRDAALIRKARIDYVIVDQRDSRDLPNQQVYIESGEYGSQDRTRPVSAQALHKLAAVRGIRQVFTDGPLVIYDVRAIRAH